MSPLELKNKLVEKLEGKSNLFLLDVRNPNEQEISLIDGTDLLIPVTELPNRVSELDAWKNSGKEIVVYCRSGVRSANACSYLKSLGFQKVHNLDGGILRYSDEVDPSIAKY
ncbi:sulfurtransferase [Leptospira perolatii]|uniref:Sulfurtransferase n=1 Tax=Leptospira perolatii TaxID=2023191 RepID=A0A2M9ZIM6_9LEPT|nr:rhodanese-like domain-containing protein [Leptospira perolatii]PJZ68336.1 sulfurtransferase [Leptospira perolatii]PJZ71824.1 sulfurtransferase [Leptospira perolatii]